MSTTMELLKGGKAAEENPTMDKTEKSEDASQTEAVTPADIKKMKGPELNALYEKLDTEIDGFSSMLVAQKRKALTETFAAIKEALSPSETKEEPKEEPEAKEEVKTEEKKAPAKKTSTKKKTEVAVAEKTAPIEVIVADPLQDIYEEVESIETADQAEAQIDLLGNNVDLDRFKIGGILNWIQEHGDFGEHLNFKEYVEAEMSFGYRKAAYLTAIYRHIKESAVTWDQVQSIGWTKLKEISDIVTMENLPEWLALAHDNTTNQLIEHVKVHKQKASGTSTEGEEIGGGSEVQKVTTKTFKLHEDQKKIVEDALQKSKEASGTDIDTVALENLCMDYLSGPTTKAKPVNLTETDFPALHNALVKEAGGDQMAALKKLFTGFDNVFTKINVEIKPL